MTLFVVGFGARLAPLAPSTALFVCGQACGSSCHRSLSWLAFAQSIALLALDGSMALLVMVLRWLRRFAQPMVSSAMGTPMPLQGIGVSALLALAPSMASSLCHGKCLHLLCRRLPV